MSALNETPETSRADEAKQSLRAHAAEKGRQLRAKYGPRIGWSEILRILEDPSCVRYPCKIAFDQEGLLSGEMAHPAPNTNKPEDGFTMHVHPNFLTRLDKAALLVLYQLVLVNYGPFASGADAEIFGANALGISTDDYYQALCEMAEEIGGCGGV
jgi:hypothetical protein